jgi:hypothetical protein
MARSNSSHLPSKGPDVNAQESRCRADQKLPKGHFDANGISQGRGPGHGETLNADRPSGEGKHEGKE